MIFVTFFLDRLKVSNYLFFLFSILSINLSTYVFNYISEIQNSGDYYPVTFKGV